MVLLKALKLCLLAGFSFVLIAVLWIKFVHNDGRLVANLLNIKSTPTSLKVIECVSPSPLDKATLCAIEVDAVDFPSLLSGYTFDSEVGSGTSYDGFAVEVGDKFPINTLYIAKNINNGYLSVSVSADKKRALIDFNQ